MSSLRSEAFFDYLREREQIRLRKEADLPFPWTKDQILRTYKFTNVRREHDRTSRVLREEFYIPNRDTPIRDILMNCALFRYFGTYEFARAVGWQTYDGFDFEGIKATARDRLAQRQRVFTGAYVVTNQGISAPKYEVVVDIFLNGLWRKIDDIIDVVNSTGCWEDTSKAMRSIPGFGGSGFMTKEVLIDTTYTDFWGGDGFPLDWWSWTPIGPGALRGASRLSGDDSAKPLHESRARRIIEILCRIQDEIDTSGFGGKLSPTDIQFGLCEFDKYERVRLGQGKPRSRYRAEK